MKDRDRVAIVVSPDPVVGTAHGHTTAATHDEALRAEEESLVGVPKQHQPRSAPPELGRGERKEMAPTKKPTYEADKSLNKLFQISQLQLTQKAVHGKAITAAALLGKDEKHRAATFTAEMQPGIEQGQLMQIFFRCQDLVDLWVVKQFGHPKEPVKPSAFVILRELQEDGKYHDVGQTESIPLSSDPNFSVPIIVRYKGPETVQAMHVQVLSYAFKMPDGILIGSCYFLLDDLVHARTARVLKLPLDSPNDPDTVKNGTVTVSGSKSIQIEDGLWLQMKVEVDRLDTETKASFPKRKPKTFFEIWRQHEDESVQVYKSELTERMVVEPKWESQYKTDRKKISKSPKSVISWWPLSLSGKKIGDNPNCILIIKVYNQEFRVEDETPTAKYLGETKFRLKDCVAGQEFEIYMQDQDKPKDRPVYTGPVNPEAPVVRLTEWKWVKLHDGKSFEAPDLYKQDLEFLKDLMDNMELNAALKENIGTRIQFVQNRAMYWSMQQVIESSDPAEYTSMQRKSHGSEAESPRPGSRSSSHRSKDSGAGSFAHHPTSIMHSHSAMSQQSMIQAHSHGDHGSHAPSAASASHQDLTGYAEDIEAALRLEAMDPLSAKSKAEEWKKSIELLNSRAVSRLSGVETISPMERLARARGVELTDKRSGNLEAREVEGQDPTVQDLEQTVNQLRSQEQTQQTRIARSALGLGDLSNLKREDASPRQGYDRLSARPVSARPSLPTAYNPQSSLQLKEKLRPQSARVAKGEELELRKRPQTARARVQDASQPRSYWRPQSARTRSERPLSGRSLGWQSERSSVWSRSTTPAAAAMEFRESIRPLLASVMRQGSVCQPNYNTAPVTSARLTPAGKFRFVNNLL